MERKLKLLLVIGRSQGLRAFDPLEPLALGYDISAATFLTSLRRPYYTSALQLLSFIENQNAPGAMLGLEEEIFKADIIVASGLTDQATAQAMRSALLLQKPFFVFSVEPMDLHWALEHDRPAAQDLLDNATGFFVYGEEASEALIFAGVSAERIMCLAPRIHCTRLDFKQQGRQRFRDYLNLSDNTYLITSCDPLAQDRGARQLLLALKLIKDQERPGWARLRCLFTGTGPVKEELKYLAADLGLSSQVLFIAQDTSPFLNDLYAASDLAISWIPRDQQESAHAAFWILEALTCGTRPLVHELHPLASALAPFFEPTIGDYYQLANDLMQMQNESHLPGYGRQALIELCRDNFDAEQSGQLVSDFMQKRAAISKTGVPLGLLRQDFYAQKKNLQEKYLSSHSQSELIDDLDQALDRWSFHAEYRGELLLLKGQWLLKMQDLEGAMPCFEQCTSEDAVQCDAYIGLGRISYLSYSTEEALSFFRKALALRPNNAEIMSGLGMVYRKCGMADEAVYWLGRSVSVELQNHSVLISLTQACLECLDQARAIDVLEQLLTLVGDKTAVVMALGQLYYRVGENEKGRALVDQALQSNLPQQMTLKISLG